MEESTFTHLNASPKASKKSNLLYTRRDLSPADKQAILEKIKGMHYGAFSKFRRNTISNAKTEFTVVVSSGKLEPKPKIKVSSKRFSMTKDPSVKYMPDKSVRISAQKMTK